MAKIPGIMKRADGRYSVRVTVGYRDGKPIRRRGTADSHADARRLLKQLKDDFTTKNSDPTTVEEFIHQWIRDDVEPHLKANTIHSYKQQSNKHIIPHIGGVKLAELTPSKVNVFAAKLREIGTPETTQAYVLRVLSQICNRAMQLLLIDHNPVKVIKRPKPEKRPIEPFTTDEARKILEYVTGQPFGGVYYLGICHGMRIGEIFGLSPESVDFDSGSLKIENNLIYGSSGPMHLDTPKTSSSRRTIMLTDKTISELNNQRKLNVIDGHASPDVLFCSTRGGFVYPPNWWRDEWGRTLKELEIPHRGCHHMRHTFATLAISEGVPITDVSKVLGHADPSITLRVYAHALEENQTRSVKVMDQLFG